MAHLFEWEDCLIIIDVRCSIVKGSPETSKETFRDEEKSGEDNKREYLEWAYLSHVAVKICLVVDLLVVEGKISTDSLSFEKKTAEKR